MLPIICFVSLFLAPFVFAHGININTFYIALIYIATIIGMNLYFKRGSNALTDLVFAVCFGVFAYYFYGVALGISVFGFALFFPLLKAYSNITMAPLIIRNNLSVLLFVSMVLIAGSFIYEIIQIFGK